MRTVLNWFFAVVLFGVLKWVFNSFAWDTTVHILQSKLGVSEADMIAGVSSFVIPGIVAFFAIAGAYNVGKRYSAPTNTIQSPAASTRTTAEISAAFRPFLVQAAVILALVSGGVGYYLHAYVYSMLIRLAPKNTISRHRPVPIIAPPTLSPT
jgi:hypothetical protein